MAFNGAAVLDSGPQVVSSAEEEQRQQDIASFRPSVTLVITVLCHFNSHRFLSAESGDRNWKQSTTFKSSGRSSSCEEQQNSRP